MSWRRVAVPLLAGAAIALIPVPSDSRPQAWYYFAVFVAVILGLITEPLPAAAVGLIGLTFAAVSGLPFTAAQRAGSGVPPAGGIAEMGARGIHQRHGLADLRGARWPDGLREDGARPAPCAVPREAPRPPHARVSATRSRSRIWCWRPSRPPNSARSAGTIYPIIRNIPELYGSQPGPTARRLGAYLMWVAFATTSVTSSMFLTALAPNLLAVGMVKASDRHRDLVDAMAHWIPARGRAAPAGAAVRRLPDLSAGDPRQRRGPRVGKRRARADGTFHRAARLSWRCSALAR